MNAREQNVTIGGNIIREKVLDFVKEFNITGFKVSEEWLDRRKNRHNVVFRIISGKENCCIEEMTASWEQNHLPTILSRYELRDNFQQNPFI